MRLGRCGGCMGKKPTDELRKLKAEKDAAFSDALNHLESVGKESIRIGEKFDNIGELLTDIDKDFSKATGITNKKDMSLLFVATGLLCAKWIIMGQIMPLDFDFSYKKQEKLTAKEGDKLADKKRKDDKKYGQIDDEAKNKAKKDYSDDEYRTVMQILFRPVPYDAMKTEVVLPVPLTPNNHRALTLGHQEILGWLFGTINIMTRSLTYNLPTLNTFTVKEKGIIIEGYSDIFSKVKEAYDIFNIEHERLYAAVFHQGLHFLSDKFTKTGLSLPFMEAEKYLDLLEQGWDAVAHANDVEKFKKYAGIVAKDVGIIAIQFVISLLINEIIKAIHLRLYDEKTDGDIRLYQVRTRKILLTSNCISSASNVLFCAGVAIATKNPLEGAKRLDIGGLIKTIESLFVDTKFIEEIKREYVREKLYEQIYDSDFKWKYQIVEG